jgi:HEXXH motif-containing protein
VAGFVAFDAAETKITMRKLARAMKAIRAVSTEAHGFVSLFLNQIVARKTQSAARWASFSTSDCIGRASFLNPQHPRYDWINLANDLVHEAIHAFHYILDDRFCLLPESEPARHVKVTSPWTGNSLSLYSYVSACFVWFGLAHFWIRALQCNEFPFHRIREHLIQCTSGFWSDDLSKPISTAGWKRAPVNKIIREMQTTIRGLGVSRR